MRLATLAALLCVLLSGCAPFESRFLRVPRTMWRAPERAEVLDISDANDARIAAWLFHPAGASPQASQSPRPVIVIAHGRTDAMGDYRVFAPRLADATESIVVVFDYRGFGASDDLENPTRRTMIDDTRVLLSALTDRAEITSDRITMWGISLGAFPAAANFAEDPTLHALILWGAPANIQGVIRDGHSELGPLTRLLAALLVPRDHAPEDMVQNAGTRPVLIAHAERDEIINVRHAHTLVEAAQSASPDVTLVIDQEGTHASVSESTLQAIIDWHRARSGG